jgi:putative phage-type endonuclease
MSGLTPEQRELRRTGIGASESPCIIGLSPFGNATSVWAEKAGLEIREATDAMELGLILEEGIARLYTKKTGFEVAHFGTLRHPEYPWMLATPDLAIFGERRIAQIKLVGSYMAHHWAEGVPDYVEVQCQHEMEVVNADHCDVLALIGGTDFRVLPLQRDREMGRDLVEVCRSFWERHIRDGEMPDPDGTTIADAAIKARYQFRRPILLTATPEAEQLGRTWLAADARIRAAEKEQALAEQKLKVIIGEHEGIEGEGFRATWKANKKNVRAFLCKELGVEKERAA